MIVRPLAFAAVFFSFAVNAAPFCVDVTGIPLQCLYVDPVSCQSEAQRQHGRCSANANEIVTPAHAQNFCLVAAGNTISCVYPDRSGCDADAKLRHGACIEAQPEKLPGAPLAPGVDPYQVQRPY